MGRIAGIASAGIAFMLLLAGCTAPGGSVGTQRATGEGERPAARKRLTVGFAGNPPGIANRLSAGAAGGTGVATLEALLTRGLTAVDPEGTRRPQMAEALPTVENGLWQVFPDGRMETTWKIRANARWHDGAPFTSDDLLFTARVDQDRDLPFTADQAYRSIEGIEAPDPLTIVVKWKAPYIQADGFFGGALLPKHLLERPYSENKAGFIQIPFWGDEYVGLGPYKLLQWERGSHVVVGAYDGFVLGRPKIDEIEVRFIPDLNTMVANILAGAVELTLAGATLSIDQALQTKSQWQDGRVDINVSGWIVAFPQLLTPDPSVIGDVRFRRALLHALDRQQMADGIQAGLTPVAHTNIGPNEREYRDVERSVTRYDYDPRRAAQLVEGLGYTKGPDGQYRDAQSRPLSLEVRSTATYDVAVKAMVAVGDGWQRLGMAVELSPTPQQLQSDREYRALFPGFNVQRQPSSTGSISRYHSSEIPLAENGYRGESKNRYMNPQLDALIDRYFLTIPWQDRMQVLAQATQHMTDQVVALGLFYDSEPRLISNRLLNVSSQNSHFNVYEWDVR